MKTFVKISYQIFKLFAAILFIGAVNFLYAGEFSDAFYFGIIALLMWGLVKMRMFDY